MTASPEGWTELATEEALYYYPYKVCLYFGAVTLSVLSVILVQEVISPGSVGGDGGGSIVAKALISVLILISSAAVILVYASLQRMAVYREGVRPGTRPVRSFGHPFLIPWSDVRWIERDWNGRSPHLVYRIYDRNGRLFKIGTLPLGGNAHAVEWFVNHLIRERSADPDWKKPPRTSWWGE